MPIVFDAPSGLSRGIQKSGDILAGALERRAERRLRSSEEEEKKEQGRKGIGAVSKWAASYNPNLSPMENLGTLESILQDEGVDPSMVQPIFQDVLKKSISQQGDVYGANQVFGGPPQQGDRSQQGEQAETPPTDRMAQFKTEDLVGMSSNPNRIVSQSAKAEIEKRKLDQSISEADRKYHTQFAAKQEEKISGLREAVPKKKSALRHARSAVESGQVGAFGPDKIADVTGMDVFRTAKGSQLVTAGKENLLSNMARVSAKAQNQWFEQRLASMFPKVGQTMEANLAIQEMLESELSMEEIYLKKFDELAEADEKLYGYPRKDLDRRARQAVESSEELAFQRSAYRIKELEENEKSSSEMQKGLMKKVPTGTPMTLKKGKMFIEKFKSPQAASDMAKKLGYSVPNGEDLRLYLMSSEEFTERLGGI